jgi:hypothetical protein
LRLEAVQTVKDEQQSLLQQYAQMKRQRGTNKSRKLSVF